MHFVCPNDPEHQTFRDMDGKLVSRLPMTDKNGIPAKLTDLSPEARELFEVTAAELLVAVCLTCGASGKIEDD